MKHQTSGVPPSWRGLQEVTQILRCFCQWWERELLAQQRKDSNLLQPPWADDSRIFEQLSQNLTSTDVPCSGRSTRFERNFFFCYQRWSTTSKKSQEATAKCRATLQSCCKATVILDAIPPTLLNVCQRRVSQTLHLRAPAAQGGSASVASHRGEQVICRNQCIRGVNRGP